MKNLMNVVMIFLLAVLLLSACASQLSDNRAISLARANLVNAQAEAIRSRAKADSAQIVKEALIDSVYAKAEVWALSKAAETFGKTPENVSVLPDWMRARADKTYAKKVGLYYGLGTFGTGVGRIENYFLGLTYPKR